MWVGSWIRAHLLGLRNSIHHGTSSFLSTPPTDVDHVAPQLAFNIVHDAALHDTSRLNKMGTFSSVGRSVGESVHVCRTFGSSVLRLVGPSIRRSVCRSSRRSVGPSGSVSGRGRSVLGRSKENELQPPGEGGATRNQHTTFAASSCTRQKQPRYRIYHLKMNGYIVNHKNARAFFSSVHFITSFIPKSENHVSKNLIKI